ncbi:glycosyltransferase family 9 protein [Candidatus Fermentibacteria bacterium]|nr:glycosyltransferase family 9 protein [Candidatus Fermentibacteria bacterium]
MTRSGVLVMSTLGVGDILLAQPLLEALRRARSDRLVVLARAGSPADLARRFRLADTVVDYVPRWPHRLTRGAALAPWIMRQRFSLVLTTTGMNPYYSALMAMASRAPLRIGEGRGWMRWAWTDMIAVTPRTHAVKRNQALGRAAGVNSGVTPRIVPYEMELEHARDLLGSDGCWIALSPGSNRHIAHKRWPLNRFAELVLRLRGRGAQIVLLGGPDEGDMGRQLTTQTGDDGITDLIGATDVGTAAAVLSRCRIAVGNDGMLLHLAAAVGTPTIAIFGPSDPELYAPVGPHSIVVKRSLSCSPCDRRLPRGCPERHCLMGIEVDEIVERLEPFITCRPIRPPGLASLQSDECAVPPR